MYVTISTVRTDPAENHSQDESVLSSSSSTRRVTDVILNAMIGRSREFEEGVNRGEAVVDEGDAGRISGHCRAATKRNPQIDGGQRWRVVGPVVGHDSSSCSLESLGSLNFCLRWDSDEHPVNRRILAEPTGNSSVVASDDDDVGARFRDDRQRLGLPLTNVVADHYHALSRSVTADHGRDAACFPPLLAVDNADNSIALAVEGVDAIVCSGVQR